MKKILGLFLGCILLLAGCYEEGSLKPSSEPELIYGKYTLPQGEHDYDDDIVKFYKQYSSLLLYKFTSKDFGWFPEGNISWNIATDTVVIPGAMPKYDAQPADELYVKEQLQLLEDKWFSYLSDTLMQLLPQRILLCSEIDLVPVGLGYNPKPEERTSINVYAGYYHIAVNWGNSRILNMTAEERNQFKKDVCGVYFESILASLDRPREFFMVSSYRTETLDNETQLHEEGFLNSDSRGSMNNDWLAYVKLAIETPIDELESGLLSEYEKIREKYTIMVKFFKDRYKFDIQAIGNDVEH